MRERVNEMDDGKRDRRDYYCLVVSYELGLYESKRIQYFCKYGLAHVNSWKLLSCLGRVSQYEKYYCLVLKFLIILGLRRRATVSESIIRKGLKPKYSGNTRST